VIDNDEPAKPDLAPWLAALWVDEDMRGRGIAGALLEEAARRCAGLGVPRLYLNSRPALRDFYTARGWRIWSAAWVRMASRSMTGNWTGCLHYRFPSPLDGRCLLLV
jgi:GNAT superfamily N-acetyltransferase